MKQNREYFTRRHNSLNNDRKSFIPHWREISEYLLPRRGRFLTSHNKNPDDGSKKNGKIIDSTGTRALRDLKAGLMSGMASPTRPWFKLGTTDPDLKEFSAVKEWLHQVERLMYQVFAKSNLYNTLSQTFEEQAAFGTHCFDIIENREHVIWCYPMTAGEYALDVGADNMVDSRYREWPMTVAQIVQEYGLDNVSTSTKNLYDRGEYSQRVMVCCAAEPNRNREKGSLLNRSMPYISVHWEKAATEKDGEKGFLRISGFNEKPFVAPRWDVNAGDVYGRSPGMDALPDIKQLQSEVKEKGRAIALKVRPPLQAPASLSGKPISIMPGAVNYVDMLGGREGGVRTMYEVTPQLAEMREDIVLVQEAIKETFYNDLFRMISLSGKDMTATEVNERVEEKLIMLSPMLERNQVELFDPIIDRTFSIMSRGRLLPPPPPDIQGQELKVEYVSTLAQAQRMVGIGAVERMAGFVGTVGNLSPDVIDKFDADQAVDEYADRLGVTPSVVRSDDDVEAIRADRAAAEQQAASAAQAAGAVDSLKTLSEVQTGPGNLVGDVL